MLTTQDCVLACSALKRSYRWLLKTSINESENDLLLFPKKEPFVKFLGLWQMIQQYHNDIIMAQNIPLSLCRRQGDVFMFVKVWQPPNKIPVLNSFICYREILKSGGRSVTFIYLKGSRDLIQSRLEKRSNHYFKAGLLHTQFETLEVITNINTSNSFFGEEHFLIHFSPCISGTNWYSWGDDNYWLQQKFENGGSSYL